MSLNITLRLKKKTVDVLKISNGIKILIKYNAIRNCFCRFNDLPDIVSDNICFIIMIIYGLY